MKTSQRLRLLLPAAWMALLTFPMSGHAEVPRLLTVQGRLNVEGTDYDGTGHFKFALVDGDTGAILWSNSPMDEATDQPADAVALPVQGGLYSVALGDRDLPHMAAIEVGPLDHPHVDLRLWFSDDETVFHRLSPDQRLTAVAYAVMAAHVEDGAVGTDQIADESITGDKLDPDLRFPGRFTVDQVLASEVLANDIAAYNGAMSALEAGNARVGSGGPAITPLHVEAGVTPGTRPENHVAFFHNRTREPNANGIAIMLGNSPDIPWVDKSNNYISFYDPAERILGRVEGYSIVDFLEAMQLISAQTLVNTVLGGGFYDFNFRLTPTEDWFDPGSLPLFDFAPGRLPSLTVGKGRLPEAVFDPGKLPDIDLTGYIAPKLTVGKGENPALSFTPGEAPSLSFNRGTLPSLSINFATASFSFNAGSRPTASFNPGKLPTATLDPGKFPTVSLDPGQPPSISGGQGTLPSLAFDPGAFPEVSYQQGTLPALDVTPGELPRVLDLPFSIEADFTLNTNVIATLIAQFQGDLAELGQAWCMLHDPVCAEIKRQALMLAGSGVTYESGSGDYAEWLPRLNASEELSFGDIVGVHGGRIARDTTDADQLLVVSYKPIVLGNMPPVTHREQHEMVAFMGQVPVKVEGVVRRGDFILASGHGDGRGRAVAPASLQPADLKHCVGVAWDESAFPGNKLIRVAIGLQPRILSQMVHEQHSRVETLKEELAETRAALDETRLQLAELTERVERLAMSRAASPPMAAAKTGLRPASFERP
ncbi:MAG: hypothetical protein H7A46_10690 [Verrucomicrobiales bacterium]|nr:hypothetical protein [Verrucomicrobiales bacterium]